MIKDLSLSINTIMLSIVKKLTTCEALQGSQGLVVQYGCRSGYGFRVGDPLIKLSFVSLKTF